MIRRPAGVRLINFQCIPIHLARCVAHTPVVTLKRESRGCREDHELSHHFLRWKWGKREASGCAVLD